MKKVFITGVTGQDGAWLAKYLLGLGYDVYGGVRRTSTFNSWRLDFLGITDKIKLVEFDLLDHNNIFTVINDLKPDEFYNLAAQSFVGTSFKQPISTSLQDGLAVTYILDTLKTVSPKTKFYQASTSEMFGKVQEVPQSENTSLYPRSPYGVAKVYAHWMTINYQESYGMFASSGILFNHESELRGPEFVTRKITLNVADWAVGKGKVLALGNIDAKRDWGYAKEYVEGMHAILQADKPDFFVLSTNRTSTIRFFVEQSFKEIGRNIKWEGEAENEKGYDVDTKELLVQINPIFYRPAEVELLIGDSSKAKNILGWEAKTQVEELCKIMVQSDINLAKKKL